ncbi:hypothetical protein ACIQAC_22365 [Streptomyces sp. NPDC088387]|uniref:hypothetical protein n=1 Tax=Streptomyces sp. NPDC088387 TaxID=3365859 RepID=UPI0037F44758
MPKTSAPAATSPYGAFRTERLWAVAGASSLALLLGTAAAFIGTLEFDERCAHGMVGGVGQLGATRTRSFPPATICEYTGGDVTAGATGIFGVLLWFALAGAIVPVVLALLADCFECPAGTPFTRPATREAKLRRTGLTFGMSATLFLPLYVLTAWPLLRGGLTGACAADGEWGSYAPRTLDASYFPPGATCESTAGYTSALLPGWIQGVVTALGVPMILAGAALALAWWRWRQPEPSPVAEPVSPPKAPTPRP